MHPPPHCWEGSLLAAHSHSSFLSLSFLSLIFSSLPLLSPLSLPVFVFLSLLISFLLLSIFGVLGMKPTASHVPGKHSSSELHCHLLVFRETGYHLCSPGQPQTYNAFTSACERWDGRRVPSSPADSPPQYCLSSQIILPHPKQPACNAGRNETQGLTVRNNSERSCWCQSPMQDWLGSM